jgi:cytochrome c-type biogenesis protein CcmH
VKVLRSFSLWAGALVVVLALILATAPSSPSDQSRIAHLESLVKCPSCENLSVAQSNATSAVAVRNEITQRVHAGASDNAILTSLESTYGTSVLLSPSTSGLGALLWLAPVLALLALAFSIWRLSRRR